MYCLCDGKKECCEKQRCYKNGGDCSHTTDIRHALNFEKRGDVFYEKEDAEHRQSGEKRKSALVPIREAVSRSTYMTCVGTGKDNHWKLFNEEEAKRAEAIVTALNGLSIESAQDLLKKVDAYLLQSLIAM